MSETIIELDKLRKEYGSLVAVNDIDLNIEKGSVVGLVGPNGAGKTTLLRMLATLLEPTSGNGKIAGLNITRNYLDVRKIVGYIPDFFGLYNDLTLRECLNFFAQSYNVPSENIVVKIEEVLRKVDLRDKADSYITELSRGMVQRIGLACMLVWEPEVYLLDEPASGLDPQARIILRNILKEQSNLGKTVIISSHILTELSGFCSHVVFMDHGKIIESGTVDDITRKQGKKYQAMIKVIESPEAAAEIIVQIPETEIKSIADTTIIFYYDGTDKILAQINKNLIEAGFEVCAVAAKKVELEELFMEISSASEIMVTEEKEVQYAG
ncbi:MAG: ABC transporter ATP-binding protein [Sedimentisphaeraceae bacterium JB056]